VPTPLNRWSALACSAAAVATALIASGCGSDTVDPSKAQTGIEKSLSTPATQVTSASCPSDVKKQKDATFTCDVKLSGGGNAQVTVTQTSNHNTFTYSFKPGTVQLPGATVDKAVEQELAAKGVPGTTVNCPTTVTVAVGKTVTCPVTGSSGHHGQVSFTFTNASGTVDSSSVKQS
jgi:hypothetical protein